MPSAATSRRQPDGQRIERRLRRRVVDVLARRAELRRARRHVDDRAAGAAVRVDIRRTASRAQRNAPVHVGGEDAIDARRRRSASTRVCRSRMPALLTSAVSGAELRRRRFRTAARRRLSTATSASTAIAFAAGRFDVGDDRSAASRLRAVVHAHGVAARGGQPRGRGADAAAAAGDDRRLVHAAILRSASQPAIAFDGTLPDPLALAQMQ